MAAIYGSSTYFWNLTISEDSLTVQHFLKNHFSTLTLITGVILVVLGPFIMIANGIVIAAILKDPFKQLRSSPSNIIIASMATCDFLVGVFASFVQASWFISMSVKARISYYLGPVALSSGTFLIGVSLIHILALTIDRVIAVVNPLLYKSRVTRKRVLISVSLIWVFCLPLGFLQIPLYKHYYIHSVASMVIFNIFGLPVGFLCSVIIYYVRKQTKELKKNEELRGARKTITERDRKTTKSILIILIFFISCFLPFFISWIVVISCSRCHPRLDALMTSFYLSYILTHVNSGVNPILYAFRLPKFRKPVAIVVKEVFFCCKLCTRFENVVASETSETSDKTPQASLNELPKINVIDNDSSMNTKL